MVRTVWLALSFLIGVCALAALKISIATPAKQEAAFADTANEADLLHDALTKADKLLVSDAEEAPEEKLVTSIPIVTPKITSQPPAEKITKIISRHWHEGYAKMTKRSARNRRHASRTKRRS
jgi:hypothetical protein